MLDKQKLIEAAKATDLSKEKNLKQFLELIDKELITYLTSTKKNGVFRLPRDGAGNLLPKFIFKDRTYLLLIDDMSISVKRFELFKKLSLSFSFSADFPTFIKEINSIESDAFQAIREPKHVQKLLERTARIKDSVLDLSQDKENYALMLFSAMSVREDEEAAELDEKILQEKIEDFKVFAMGDILFFSRLLINGYDQYYQQKTKEKEKLQKQLTNEADTNTASS